MSDRTGIPYLDATWNPISMRCTPCSPGCANCWARGMQDRLPALQHSGGPVLNERTLGLPLHWEKPRRIGVQFMGDLFHPTVPREMIQRVLDTIDLCPQHTFVLLTKRFEQIYWKMPTKHFNHGTFPRNIWFGLSLCTQEEVHRRWIQFTQSMDEIRPSLVWLSLEPMLEAITLGNVLTDERCRVGWVVAGCESGRKRRPARDGWFSLLRDECVEHGVPFYLKQKVEGRKVVKLPELDGIIWDRIPDALS